MNICFYNAHQKSSCHKIHCPTCHGTAHRKNGSYARKGFHGRQGTPVRVIRVQRYRCLNPHCSRCTFSVLPPMVLRYCRFLWPCLLSLWAQLGKGVSRYHLATHIWKVSRGVVVSTKAMLEKLNIWVLSLYREVFNGRAPTTLELMVKRLTAMLRPTVIIDMWYCHYYPGRFIIRGAT
jgi:hypothetical protein